MKLGYVIHGLEVSEYQHFENPSPSFFEVFSTLSSKIREILEHPLEPPIRARPPAELRGGGGGVGVAAEIKTGYATLSRNKFFNIYHIFCLDCVVFLP